MVASVATYPHEVVRTRLQTQRRLLISTGAPRKRSGIVRTTTKILHFEGWRGLYKGLSVNLIRTVPNSAVTMLTCVQPIRYRGPSLLTLFVPLPFDTPQIRIVNASPYDAWDMIASTSTPPATAPFPRDCPLPVILLHPAGVYLDGRHATLHIIILLETNTTRSNPAELSACTIYILYFFISFAFFSCRPDVKSYNANVDRHGLSGNIFSCDSSPTSYQT
jgi:hypothetical protein